MLELESESGSVADFIKNPISEYEEGLPGRYTELQTFFKDWRPVVIPCTSIHKILQRWSGFHLLRDHIQTSGPVPASLI
jgi:hypothetical protein